MKFEFNIKTFEDYKKNCPAFTCLVEGEYIKGNAYKVDLCELQRTSQENNDNAPFSELYKACYEENCPNYYLLKIITAFLSEQLIN